LRTIKPFEEFIKEGTARKIPINKERAKSLLSESERKLNSLNKNLEKVGIDDENANDYVEYCYDILLFIIRARMYEQGYTSSGKGAHEAEVSFTRKMDCTEKDIQFLDELRYFRNGILYYGKRFDEEYARKVVKFMKRLNHAWT